MARGEAGCAAEVVMMFLEFVGILIVGWGLARKDERGMGIREARTILGRVREGNG